MQVVTGTFLQPLSDLWRSMRAVIIQHQMDLLMGWNRLVDLVEKTNKLLMPMPLLALAHDLPRGDIQGRK